MSGCTIGVPRADREVGSGPAARPAAACGRAIAVAVGVALGAAIAAAQAPVDPLVREAIQELLDAYSGALESLDADEVKLVQPSIDAVSLRRAFSQMRALEVQIDEVRILQADQASARVSCRVTQRLIPRVGAAQSTAITRVVRLRRLTDRWVIDGFER